MNLPGSRLLLCLSASRKVYDHDIMRRYLRSIPPLSFSELISSDSGQTPGVVFAIVGILGQNTQPNNNIYHGMDTFREFHRIEWNYEDDGDKLAHLFETA